jgi:hypothetical protein
MSPLRSHRRDALRLLLGGVALTLAGCGRKGAPLPPYDVDPCYPRHYPMDDTQKQLCARKEEYAREHPPQPPPPKKERKSSATSSTQPPEPAQPATLQSDLPQNQPAPQSKPQ